MLSKNKFGIILYGFILGALLAFTIAQTVHAEDATPTPEDTPTEVVTPVPTDPTSTDIATHVPTDSIPTDTSTPAPTDPALNDTSTPVPTESTTPEPTLTETPNPGGDFVISMGSPILFAAATPMPDVWITWNGTIRPYSSIASAFSEIKGGKIPSDGLIHLESTYGGESGSVDLYYQVGGTLGPTGLLGLVGSSVDPDTLAPTISINQMISVYGFSGGFSISNLAFNGNAGDSIDDLDTAVGLLNLINISGPIKLTNLDIENGDSRGVGLVIALENGPVSLSNVKVDDNSGGGAFIQTDNTGSISITNSSFDHNGGINLTGGIEINGLMIETLHSNSSVYLNGVSASRNQSITSPGLLIKKSGPLTIKNSIFNNNLGGGVMNETGGLIPSVKGTVILDNVTASDNYQSSPDIRGGSGIELYTNGTIKANNIYTVGNLNYGMLLDNCNYSGAACSSASIGNISIYNSEISQNFQYAGLNIISRGSVTLTSVSAQENNNPSGQGVYINNQYGIGAVSLNGTVASPNFFYHNGLHGLEIESRGTIKLNYVISNENNGDGAYLVNNTGPGTVTVSNSTFNNNTSNGLNILAKNTVSLNGITANQNTSGDGVFIDNFYGSMGIGKLSLVNITTNQNANLGINVKTMGTITSSALRAANNPRGGAILNNQEAYLPKNITLSNGLFDENKSSSEDGIGLELLTKGINTLTLVGANQNGLDGIKCVRDLNVNMTYCGSITINNATNPGAYSISGNLGIGLNIITNGTVSMTGVDADGNKVGAFIDNTGGTGSITVSISHFNESINGNGLDVNSKGKITLTKTSASGNSGNGATLINQFAPVFSPVSIVNDPLKLGSMSNGFCGNTGYGLQITARGIVTLNNVEANGNNGFGASITNNDAATADIKITNSYFNGKEEYLTPGGYGLNVTSMGNIILNGGSANGNYTFGAKLENLSVSPTSPKNITINNFAFNKNLNNNVTDNGLEVLSKGVITLTKVQGNGNGKFGITLTNNTSTTGAGVSVKASSMDGNLAGNGLEITSSGTVFLDGITANQNAFSEGIKITSTPVFSGSKSVTINRTSASYDGSGIEVDCDGPISINGLTANNNLTFGASLDNHAQSITSGVIILATFGPNSFNLNQGGNGLNIISRGQVSLTSVTASGNSAGNGINIENDLCAGSCLFIRNVIFNKVTTRGNNGEGAYIKTNGTAVTLTGMTSLTNGGSGVAIVSQNVQAKISLINGLFMSNGIHGIDIAKVGSLSPVLTGTSYFGNAGANLYIH